MREEGFKGFERHHDWLNRWKKDNKSKEEEGKDWVEMSKSLKWFIKSSKEETKIWKNVLVRVKANDLDKKNLEMFIYSVLIQVDQIFMYKRWIYC